MEESELNPTKAAVLMAEAAVRRESRRVRLAIWVERVIAAFWPVWAMAALFLGLVLLGLPAQLPSGWHAALLAAFAAGGLFLLARGAFSLRRPRREEILARLDDGVRGRPAQSYADALASATGDAGTEALWAAHIRRMAERAAKLRAKAPDLRASGRDPFALRHGALIALAAGGVAWFATDEGSAVRLAEQFAPGAMNGAAAAPSATLEAWATPPAYTGANPVYLTRLTDGAPVTLPAGSEISLRVFDIGDAPGLETTAVAKEGAPAFAAQGAGVYDSVFTLAEGGLIRVTDGAREMGAWTIAVTPDGPPTIAFDGEPHAGERGALTLPYIATDDYGISDAEAVITLDQEGASVGEGASLYEPIDLDLPLPLTGNNREVRETLITDLTAHPWAGLPVVYRIVARDAAGQSAEAETRGLLPARRFTHPLAKALVEQRRALAFSLDAGPRVLDVLEAVTNYPEDVFDDETAYLVTRIAIRRLSNALEDGRLEAEAKSVVDLLWKAALRLEDGDLSNAAERLARAQQRLQDAIENGASDDEVSRLMEELRQAMREYMAEMMREALRDQARGEQQQPQGEQQTLSMDDLERMLRELEDAIRNGDQELARQMLQALQQLMQNLQMAQPGQGGPGQDGQMSDELGDMIGEQQGLADRSFNEMRRGQGQQGQGQQGQGQQGQQGRGQQGQGQGQQGQGQGGEQGDSAGAIARDQEALRQLLDQLRNGLPGEVGEGARGALGEAERAMRDAIESLENGDERQAVDDQVRALDALREGRRAMDRDMAEARRNRDGMAGRDGPGADGAEEDPLGRPRASGGPMDGDSVTVPGGSMSKRARELQDEIRRRAGEPARPSEELDYLDRLLDRF